MLHYRLIGLVIAAAFIGRPELVDALSALAISNSSDDDVTWRDEVSRHLGLFDFDIVEIGFPAPESPDEGFLLGIDTNLGLFVFNMRQHSVRSQFFHVIESRGHRAVQLVAAPPVRTFRGEDSNGAKIAASIINGQINAYITLDDELIVVQPLDEVIAGAAPDAHVVYKGRDILAGVGECGMTAEYVGHLQGSSDPFRCLPVIAEIAFDADVEYYEDNGSSIPNVVADIEGIMNACNIIYENEVQIRHEITTIIVRTEEPDPYTTRDPDRLLDQLEGHWIENHGEVARDITHLMTGKDLNGNIVGYANIGGPCFGYGLSQSGWSINFARRVALTAHELGHNWSANHCNADDDCGIMCSFVGGCSGSLTRFGSEPVIDILDERNESGCLRTPCAPASFQGVGHLFGLSSFSAAYGVTPDGSLVVGASMSNSGDGDDLAAFKWTWADGIEEIGDFSGGVFASQAHKAHAVGVGDIVGFGHSESGREAFRWNPDDHFVGLGDLAGGSFDSIANDVSHFGGVIVGESMSTSGLEAFRWVDDSGLSPLGDFAGGVFASAALGTNVDGSVVVGYGSSVNGREAFRWTNTIGMVGLGDLPGGIFDSAANSTSADGSVIVGIGNSALGNEAFRWTETDGIVGFGDLAGGSFHSEAKDVSDDGRTVVGFGTTAFGTEAFIWEPVTGVQNLRTLLTARFGLELDGWILSEATGISEDGLTIVGRGINPDGNEEGWVATLNAGTRARVASFVIDLGDHIGGNAADLRESDDDFLKVDSEFIEGGNPPYLMIVEVKFKSLIVEPTDLSILVESKLNENGGIARLYLRNWQQGGWSLISSDAIGKIEMLQDVDGLDPQRFINANGVIRLRIRYEKTTTSDGNPFRSMIDYAQAVVR